MQGSCLERVKIRTSFISFPPQGAASLFYGNIIPQKCPSYNTFFVLTFFHLSDTIKTVNFVGGMKMSGSEACGAISLLVTLIPAIISGIAAFFICKK